MNRRAPAWLAWSMCTLTVVLTVLTLLLVMRNEPGSFWIEVIKRLGSIAAALVGALVAVRRPANPIGWLFGIGTLLSELGVVALEYAVYALVTQPGALPAGEWMMLVGEWARGFGFQLVVAFLLLLYPTGRLPAPRWRPAAWLAVALLVLFTVAVALSPRSNDFRLAAVRNPIGIESAITTELPGVSYLLFLVVLIACAAAVIRRFQRAKGEERQQLKWFTYAASLAMVLLGVMLSLSLAQIYEADYVVSSLIWSLAFAGFPIAAGVAILRYRLYDIDIIINRTLVYGTLTGLLALIYFGSAVVLQGLFRTLTGQESNLAVVVSTLASAALFQPLRSHIQAFIDRRFYRRKYDATRTLAAFSARLRDEVDLTTLSHELVAIVNDTMQPAHVSLWLRAGSSQPSAAEPSPTPAPARLEHDC